VFVARTAVSGHGIAGGLVGGGCIVFSEFEVEFMLLAVSFKPLGRSIRNVRILFLLV